MALAHDLAERLSAGNGAAVTWYNHWSVGRSMDGEVAVDEFTHVGLDGMLLRSLVDPSAPRTSADLVLPLLLARVAAGCRIALVGSTRSRLAAAAAAVLVAAPHVEVVLTCDGYEGLVPADEMAASIREAGVDVVIVGLGSPLQDQYVLALRAHGLDDKVLLTCGGWLDQVSNSSYYPRFAYALKINWLVRVLREPRRLWRRYSVEAVAAMRRREQMRLFLLERAAVPFGAMVGACSTTEEAVRAARSPASVVGEHDSPLAAERHRPGRRSRRRRIPGSVAHERDRAAAEAASVD